MPEESRQVEHYPEEERRGQAPIARGDERITEGRQSMPAEAFEEFELTTVQFTAKYADPLRCDSLECSAFPGIFPLGDSFAIPPPLGDGRFIPESKEAHDSCQGLGRHGNEVLVAETVDIGMTRTNGISEKQGVMKPQKEIDIEVIGGPRHTGEAQGHVSAISKENEELCVGKELDDVMQVAAVFG
jgi:hypothetical protein